MFQVTTSASVASARSLSSKGTVLLRNEGLLPLARGKNVAVIGLADSIHGIRDAVGDSGSVVFNCGMDVEAAVELAKQSDYAVVFVGTLSGEGSDRSSLSLDVGTEWAGQNQAFWCMSGA
ncbi:bglB [Symbiodinium natans]|uniref:beta-glucosidase n=1 Tax=Symbiodinium natans TaxID=878477 RepID=A0A812UHM0_9DINO|nr:bglB [Symbiodinium natans]